MRIRLARALRAIADRLAGQPEVDALRLGNRRLTIDLAAMERRFKAECEYVERLLVDRDALQQQGVFWLRTAGDLSEALILQGNARAHQRPEPLPDRVVVPFGRRNRPAAPTPQGPAA